MPDVSGRPSMYMSNMSDGTQPPPCDDSTSPYVSAGISLRTRSMTLFMNSGSTLDWLVAYSSITRCLARPCSTTSSESRV